MTDKSTDIFYGELNSDTFKLTDSTLNKVLGSRLKHRRQLMGLNQTELGKKLQISGQQIHKYEAGIDQLSAPKIYELSSIHKILKKLGCKNILIFIKNSRILNRKNCYLKLFDFLQHI